MKRVISMCVGIIIPLVCQSCSDGGMQSAPMSVDVSGAYLIRDGYQDVSDSDGYYERIEVTATDEMYLDVAQSGNAVLSFTCLGELDDDIVQCNHIENVSQWGVYCCQLTTGTIKFFDNRTAGMSLHIELQCPNDQYTATSDIELQLSYASDVCGDITWACGG